MEEILNGKCPAIVGVVFDDESLKAIERINELHELEQSAKFFISIGNLLNIFAGNAVKGAGSSGLTKAISAVPFVKNSDSLSKVKDVSVAIGKGISSDVGQTAWNITQANWEYYFKSYSALEVIKREQIYRIATYQAVIHTSDRKQYRFWKAISDGCKL
ncbi:TPA: hypothetical protein NJ265_004802 [Vibrio parahaemolyticus]|nr:hypothetical protein [Vibrio parahaemolyticus]TOH00490.1 hypothetical protein CGI88_24055 [Vibrio parahaemolyticus]HCE1830114.1 hypothetical protein [Vibrio parahaemolyticus]HCE5185150.1 hypothetical protein [Vibrio parahaemolyticus]HCG5606210.1 hypothetical protein [Vibrio parahaemolyticus]